MKAWVLHGIKDLRFENVEMPLLEPDMVRVRVKAVGICGSDIPRIFETGAHKMPLICGHEFSGVVDAVGKKADPGWLQKRVGVFPLIPCMKCSMCRDKHYEMCRDYDYIGSRRNGAFAEYVNVPEWNLIKLPDNITYETAAMMEPMAVAVHAMRRALFSNSEDVVPESVGMVQESRDIVQESMDIVQESVDMVQESMAIAPASVGKELAVRTASDRTDKSVAVIGLGTIGMLLAMFLWDAGYRNLLLIGNKDFQRQLLMEAGIPDACFCNSRTADAKDWLRDRTDGEGADIFFECVGKNETASFAVENASPSGKVMLVGNPHDRRMTLERDVYWGILRKQLTVYGTWNSSFRHEDDDDWNYVIDRLASGTLHPERLITHRLNIGKLKTGLDIMHEKKENYCKVMMEI